MTYGHGAIISTLRLYIKTVTLYNSLLVGKNKKHLFVSKAHFFFFLYKVALVNKWCLSGSPYSFFLKMISLLFIHVFLYPLIIIYQAWKKKLRPVCIYGHSITLEHTVLKRNVASNSCVFTATQKNPRAHTEHTVQKRNVASHKNLTKGFSRPHMSHEDFLNTHIAPSALSSDSPISANFLSVSLSLRSRKKIPPCADRPWSSTRTTWLRSRS